MQIKEYTHYTFNKYNSSFITTIIIDQTFYQNLKHAYTRANVFYVFIT